jgi:signal transduction histidine kinase
MQLPIPAAPPVNNQTFYSPLKYITLARCLYAILALVFSLIWIVGGDSKDLVNQNTKLLLFAVIEIFFFTLLTCFALLRQKFMGAITYFGMLHDACFAALLVLLTAITTSPFSFLFLIIPLYGGLILRKRGGLIAAGITIIAIFTLYLLFPSVSWIQGTWMANYIHASGISADNVPWKEAANLAIASVAIGILTGQLASQYAIVKTNLVVTARDFAHLRGIYAKVLESLPVGVIIVNSASKDVLFANPAAKNAFGAEMDSQTFAEKMTLMRSQHQNHWEHITKDDKTLHIAYFPIIIDNVQKADGYHISDITDLRNAQKKMIQKKRLEHLGEFSAKVAHEIRNPLACISGCAEILEADCNAPEQKTVFDMMTTEIDRLNNLLKDILVFARTPRLSMDEVDVTLLIEKQKEIFLTSPQAEKVKINIQSMEQQVVVHTDQNVIAQIIMTLWQNSLEATQGNAVIDVIIQNKSILISDNGPGIPETVEPHIFEPFYTTKAQGTGLGLATARQLARDLGFDLRYHANSNQFEICFEISPSSSVLVKIEKIDDVKESITA